MLKNQVRVGRRWVFRWLAGGIAAAVLVVLGLSGAATPAQAALPDKFGFVLWNGAGVVPSGTSPNSTTVAVLGPGRYQVTFPGQGATNGVAHVTAINNTPHWCQLNGIATSGANEVIGISCYAIGGVADPSGFSAIFSKSSGTTTVGRFGYVDSLPSGALVSTYNSVLGGGNTVTPGAPGQWTVKFAALATPGPIDGSWQATAVSPQIPARCKLASWTSGSGGQVGMVRCFDASGAPLNTEFTLTYQYQRALYGGAIPPKYFGYLWNTPPLGPASTNFNSQGAINTIVGGGPWLVTFPKLAALPDDIQVTATGTGSEFCGLNTPWTHTGLDTVVRDVTCYNNAGTPANPGFLISDNSQN